MHQHGDRVPVRRLPRGTRRSLWGHHRAVYGAPRDLLLGRSEEPAALAPIRACTLFRRSSSHRTLQSRCLCNAITASELLECPAGLPSLDYLFISDHPTAVGGTRPHHLITTNLLRKLSPEGYPDPDDCLVPNLEIIELRTLGWFTDDTFLDFVGPRSLRPGMLARLPTAIDITVEDLLSLDAVKGIKEKMVKIMDADLQHDVDTLVKTHMLRNRLEPGVMSPKCLETELIWTPMKIVPKKLATQTE
ncbi:hypothetical protein DFH06DRAFT_1371565 [Mycena polygramma]|nr:hypothetical protein DFH06DRAFT_1371565 [Mycena polygramma]